MFLVPDWSLQTGRPEVLGQMGVSGLAMGALPDIERYLRLAICSHGAHATVTLESEAYSLAPK
jgi:hypothetical protein